MKPSLTTLASAPIGRQMRIRELNSEPTVCIRLRELGFCENAVVRCLTKDTSKMICEICNTRVGLQSSLAATILISPLE